MSRRNLAAGLLVILTACVSTEDQLRTLQQYGAISASPATGTDYDYSVVIRNLRPLGIDTGNPVDRQRLAAAYLGSKCPQSRIVSETELATATPGLVGTRMKDYAIRLKC